MKISQRVVAICIPTVVAAFLQATPVLAKEKRVTLVPVASAELIKARQLFFGAENVDAITGSVRDDLVIATWLTNASLAVSIRGRIVLLESYASQPEMKPGRTLFVIQDLLDLHPEAILLGHGHNDHAGNAAYLSGKLNIPMYSTAETCDAMQVDAGRTFSAGTKVNCIEVVPRDPSATGLGDIGRDTAQLDFLEPLACVTVFREQRSGPAPRDTTSPIQPVVNLEALRDADMYPKSDADNRYNASGAGVGAPVSLYYTFVLRGAPNFTFMWHNTTGWVKQGGSVVTLGFATDGLRDIVQDTQRIQPKLRPMVFDPDSPRRGATGSKQLSSFCAN